MHFFRRMPIAAAGVDVDPRATPATVRDDRLFEIPDTLRGSDGEVKRLLLALEGTAGQSATLEVYALDEATGPQRTADSPTAGKDARRFYRADTAGIVVPVGSLRQFTENLPSKGTVYLRVTVAPAAAATLKVGCG